MDLFKAFRDKLSHWFGHETYDEAYARFLAEQKPLAEQIKDIEAYNRVAVALKEARRAALDRDGEYERGIEGLQ